MADSVIQFSQAVKDYGRRKIGPLDLRINKGEILGFLGPNGSGKTTSIRLILGLIRPSSGQVSVNGLDPIRDHTRALHGVGYSPELPNIQTFLTPQEVLALIAKTLRIPSTRVNEEIGRILELVGLTEYRSVKVGKMSKGMVQRLSIAQAMLGSPEVLILDEPMIGLDPAGTVHLREVFHEFARKDHGTVFMSSHMMNEVENLCDNAAIIHNGKLLISGGVQDVTRKIMGHATVVVEAEGVTPDVVEKVRKLDGVTNVQFDGGRSLQVEINRDGGSEDDLRPLIAEIIVESKGRLFTIKPADNVLEKAYIKALTSTGGKIE